MGDECPSCEEHIEAREKAEDQRDALIRLLKNFVADADYLLRTLR